MSEVKQELVMETTHGRKSKCKTEFKAVMNKVLVSGLILTTLLSSTIMPAMAADNNYITLNSDSKIVQEYGISVEQSIVGIKNTIKAINDMRKSGAVTDGILQSLANQLLSLESSVRISGDGVTQEVRDIIFEAEKAVQGLSNSQKVNIALTVVKTSLGIDSSVIEESVTLKNNYANATVTSFSDLPSNHWAYNDVMTIANKGIISGTTTPVNGVGTYDPNGTVTLGQFLAIATRLVASDKIVEGNHSHWASKNYNAAVQSGLIRSSDFGSSPEALNAPISRQDMAYILVNVAKANGETLEYKYGIENNIKDLSAVLPVRRDAVLQAYSNGLLTGKGYNQFAPYDNLTRAEVAAVFCRVMNYTTRPTVTVQQQKPSSSGNTYSSYLSDEGQTEGLIIPKYAREFDLQALNNVKFGEDEKGVYVEFTAPTLPDELKDNFRFIVATDIESTDDSYFCGGERFMVKSGESGKKYFEHYDGVKITKSMIGGAKVTVAVTPITSTDSTIHHTVYSSNKTKINESNNSGYSENIDYNSSHIWLGIGK